MLEIPLSSALLLHKILDTNTEASAVGPAQGISPTRAGGAPRDGIKPGAARSLETAPGRGIKIPPVTSRASRAEGTWAKSEGNANAIFILNK